MTTIDFFKQQAKKFLKDYNTRTFNEYEEYYEYHPQFFEDFDDIELAFNIDAKEDFGLMNAQHIIALLAGFEKWVDLTQSSQARLELGRLLLIHRVNYQNGAGLFANFGGGYLLEDWKMYEHQYLGEFDDESKLEIFKEVFLSGDKSNKRQSSNRMTINFSDDENAQDMIAKIMKEKNTTGEKAVLSSITQSNCIRIIETGWAATALSLWGHSGIDVEKKKLSEPIVQINFNKSKVRLIQLISEHEQVDFLTALKYFMMFHLESMGYHI